MIKFFGNKWVKRFVSLFSPVYCALVGAFAYYAVFYDMVLLQPQQAMTMVIAVSVAALILMLYTREQFLTKLVSILLLPGMLLPLLMYFGQWTVLIPPLVVAVIIFFFSGMGETGKTVWGTFILLLYLIGSLIYFVITSMFAPSTITTTVMNGDSPSGLYRYTVAETVDSSNGSTTVVIEPNAMDVNYDIVLFRIKGLERNVKIERPMQTNVTIEWKTEKREDISKQLNGISNDIEVTLSDAQMDLLDRDAYQINYLDGNVEVLRQADYHAAVVQLTPEMQSELETEKTELNIDDMGPNTMRICGIESVENFRTVKLSTLTDEELVKLGIPEEGDVMYYNGEVVFRYYIAILEEYFALSNRDLSLW